MRRAHSLPYVSFCVRRTQTLGITDLFQFDAIVGGMKKVMLPLQSFVVSASTCVHCA
jgi:hypothetical protein